MHQPQKVVDSLQLIVFYEKVVNQEKRIALLGKWAIRFFIGSWMWFVSSYRA